MNKIWIRLAIFVGLFVLFIGIGRLWWYDAVSSANSKDKTTQIFVVKSGESARTIVTRLKNAGLIRDQIGFFLLIKLNKSDNKLQVGNYRLNPSMNATEIMNELFHGTSDVKIQTKEGWRLEEIALVLSQDLGIPESEFVKDSREGYMFPNTYFVFKDASAGAVIQKFTDDFNLKVTPEIIAGFKKQKLTLDEGITLASIVQREGKKDDFPIIAGILLKRLENDWPLQVDATIQYILGYDSIAKTWWKKSITNEDKKIKSPYNTYLNVGLPSAPICNPGSDAIEAVANPIETDYWYYLHDSDEQAHYARTLEEHEANISKYIN